MGGAATNNNSNMKDLDLLMLVARSNRSVANSSGSSKQIGGQCVLVHCAVQSATVPDQARQNHSITPAL